MGGLRAVRGDKWWTLVAMCSGLFLINLDITIINTALPVIQRELDASPATLEWTVNAYALALAVLLLLGGSLGDRFGRRRVFLVGMAVFTAFSVACAVAPDAGWLVAMRAGQGAGAALIAALTLSIIVATFEPRELPKAIGVYAGISALALAIGPLVGGVLTEYVGWSAIFWVNVPIGILGGLLTAAVVRESRNPHAMELDPVGATLATGGLFLIVWALIGTTHHSWTSPQTLVTLGGGLVLMAAFALWELRHRAPMVPMVFFRRTRFTVPVVAQSFLYLAVFGVIYFMTLYFQNVRGWTPVVAGLAALPMTVMIVILGPVSAPLQARFGVRALTAGGLAAAALGLVGLTRIGVDTTYAWIWPFYVLLGAGLAVCLPASSSLAMASVDRMRSGVASGVLNASRQVGAALGLAILGAVGSALATRDWDETLAPLPETQRQVGERLDEAVVGGQATEIGRIAGPAAQDAAAHAFVSGLHGALWVAAGLTAAAALIAWVGLRPQEQGAGASAAPGDATASGAQPRSSST